MDTHTLVNILVNTQNLCGRTKDQEVTGRRAGSNEATSPVKDRNERGLRLACHSTLFWIF